MQPAFQSPRVIVQSRRFGDTTVVEAQGCGGFFDEGCMTVGLQEMGIVFDDMEVIISRYPPPHP
jgi:hypothetical protein